MFEMKTIGDYHDLYLKTDALLLADIFEKFITVCIEYYGLDPYHYFSSPGLSLDTVLKMTDVGLELIVRWGQSLTFTCLLKKVIDTAKPTINT